MPYEDPDPEDPTVLLGVPLEVDEDAVREMAWTFAEEYAALGFSEDWLLRMFENPAYAGPHQALLVLGADVVAAICREAVEVFGRVRFVTRDAARPGGLAPPAQGARPSFRPLPMAPTDRFVGG